MSDRPVRIGGASGFWGDAALATRQLLDNGRVDFIVYDYLAEITMSILARARAKDAALGYATDFVSAAVAPNLERIAEQGVKIVSNAGGLNPRACAAALEKAIDAAGIALKVAWVAGDDLTDRAESLSGSNIVEIDTKASFPDPRRIASVNAYAGALAIAEALNMGADIVVTGRCVDSAVTLGVCLHAHGWKAGSYDLLAAGSLAGHIIECGPQATGGNFTDWELCADTIETIGYPIVEVEPDGQFSVSKPEGSGGLVSTGTVAEQILYEIGDPQAYKLPDVTCDFSEVRLEQAGDDIVAVTGAKGAPPPDTLKVCATWMDGYRGGHLFSFTGFDADRKAKRFADAAVNRAGNILRSANLPDYTETSVEVIGAESQYGGHARAQEWREVCVKLAARHADEKAVALLFREAVGLGLSAPPGLSGFAGTRPRPSPVVRLYSFLLPRDDIALTVTLGDATRIVRHAPTTSPAPMVRPTAPITKGEATQMTTLRLIDVALARSGDKGDKANIGVIARDPDVLRYLWEQLTEDFVADRFAHFLEGRVERFYLPGLNAINFLLHDCLGGGGVASLRNDPQAKAYAQILLAAPIHVPNELALRLERRQDRKPAHQPD
ncbi:MAG: hypothetical protein MnENMB40S_22770 [Rhizobiaceae bacterium MnEN-MB40S]|nr:MAG: hypothetical protein MnENMB40S_22770 [Rhizobiaceae bacterium MnEN-MB40S]